MKPNIHLIISTTANYRSIEMSDNTERFGRSWLVNNKPTTKYSTYRKNESDDFVNAGQTLSLEDNTEEELDFNDEE